MPTFANNAESQWSAIIPPRTDRAFLVGMTGCGKTTLARYLLSAKVGGKERKHRVVIDYKGRINWPEYRVYTTLKRLVHSREPLLLYRPSYAESMDDDTRDKLWEWIYRRGGTTAYVDELTTFTQGDVFPFHFGNCLVRGREKGIEVFSGTQRPTKIPQVVLSESEHNYVFPLRLPQDRERVEAVSGVNRGLIAGLQKHHFYYSRQDSTDVLGPFRLSL